MRSHTFIASYRSYLWAFLCLFGVIQADEVIPVSYQGRFLPADAYAKQWFYNFYHRTSIKKNELEQFHLKEPAAIDFVWEMLALGHDRWDDSSLFWVRQAKVKELLHLPLKSDRFSYRQLHQAIYDPQSDYFAVLSVLITHQYLKNFHDLTNYAGRTRLELQQLAPELWIDNQKGKLVVVASPKVAPWNFLKPGMVITNDFDVDMAPPNPAVIDELMSLMSGLLEFESYRGSSQIASEISLQTLYQQLIESGMPAKEIGQVLEMQYPLKQRLQQAGVLLKALPGKLTNGEWYSLNALEVKIFDTASKTLVPVSNFTLYSDDLFNEIRDLYQQLQLAIRQNSPNQEKIRAQLTTRLADGYQEIASAVYLSAAGKQLRYPTQMQLRAEEFYTRYPLVGLCIAGYALSLLLLLMGLKYPLGVINRLALLSLIIAFGMHTALLALRSYILGRPPVSNMFETLLYVPWIGVLAGLLLAYIYRSRLLAGVAAFSSLALMLILQITQIDSSFSNVQAVLDSQYWLIVHVLLVVGSYGVFVLCGILGHLYLGVYLLKGRLHPALPQLAHYILQTMYIGVGMLIPGTLLGGVWAAESWGRFWDWDPKESWAFISICVYLIWIHAYRFHRIADLGLAIGSVTGLLAIGFTWYGVNYILGTGLHSYGFGQGGEGYYYLYLLVEIAFLLLVLISTKKQRIMLNEKTVAKK